MSDVFISYSRLDKDFVSQLREALTTNAQDVWIDWEDIPPSQSWWNEIQKGIAKANNFVLVMSPNSLSSPICHMEIEYARHLKKRIIPVMHADYTRDECLKNIAKRLDTTQETTTREIWGNRLPDHVFDANDSDLRHINYFFFKQDADFKTRFNELFAIIRTDYEHKEQHTTLLLRANEWERRARDASFLLLDTELEQAKAWLAAASGKEPPPTDLHRTYIQASEQRDRQLNNIRRASIIGSLVAVLALIFAVGASVIGFQATNSANMASTQVANANEQLATATRISEQAFQAEATLGAVNTQVAVAMVTVTDAAAVQEITESFAHILLNVEDPKMKIALLDDLVERYPEKADAYHMRGTLYDDLEMYDEAIADFTEGIRLAPYSGGTYHNRGVSYMNKGEYEKAMADFNESIRINPEFADSYNARAATAYWMGNYEQAMADYTEAIRLNPEAAIFYAARADVAYELGNYEQSIADYSEAIRLDPESAVTYASRGDVAFTLGNYEQAAADYTEAIRLEPLAAIPYASRGNASYVLGDYEQAIADYSQAIRLDPQFVAAYNSRAYVYFAMGDFDRALASVTTAIRLAPEDPNNYDSRCELYLKTEQWALGIADCDKVLSLNPEWQFMDETQALLDEAREKVATATAEPNS